MPLASLCSLLALLASSAAFSAAFSAGPSRRAPSTNALHYVLSVDTLRFAGVGIELRIADAPAEVIVAHHAHPEYDDRYWRYVERLRAVDGAGRALSVSRIDSVRWRVRSPGGTVHVSYRVRFPVQEGMRSSWRPYLTPTGGLIGGPHSFLYPVGREAAPAHVTLRLPASWRIATGLTADATARELTAPDLFTLMESPVLTGALRLWHFDVRGVPHRVAYWPRPEATPFDSAAFVRGIARFAEEAVRLFDGMPYRDYASLFMDGAYSGGLEHPNSVTMGAPSAELAKDPLRTIGEIAHEFTHTWNLMAIRPAAYRGVDHRVQPPVDELWFSEGLTIFYADLLRRRAGLPVDDSSRIEHLRGLIERYLASPGNARLSATATSRVEYNASPMATGDYTASSHLQGELLGAMLDLLVRDASDGARSMDDVMRWLYREHRAKPFTNADVARAVGAVCRCDVRGFFAAHVTGAGAIDFDRWMAPLGLRVVITRGAALDPDGSPSRDLRVWGWNDDDGAPFRLKLSDPASLWGRAGLHTGDTLVRVATKGRETTIRAWPEFRAFLAGFAMGDSATLVVRRGRGEERVPVVMRGYERVRVRVEAQTNASGRATQLRARWLSAD